MMNIKAKLEDIPLHSPLIYGPQYVDKTKLRSYLGLKTTPPPILVAKDKKNRIFILDGFHRRKVALCLKHKTIKAWVISYDELLEFAIINKWVDRTKFDEIILCRGKSYGERYSREE